MGTIVRDGIPSEAVVRPTGLDGIQNAKALIALVAGDLIQITADDPGHGYLCTVTKATTRIDGWSYQDCPIGEVISPFIRRPGLLIRYSNSIAIGTMYYLDPTTAGGITDAATTTPIANPTAPVVPSEGATGALGAGDYSVGYTDVNSHGETLLSAVVVATIGASKKLHIAALALAAGATSRNFYISRAPGVTDLGFAVNVTSGAAFDINALPVAGDAEPPQVNTTAAANLRVGIGCRGGTILFL